MSDQVLKTITIVLLNFFIRV